MGEQTDLMAEFVEERFVWVIDHQDFVQSHVKPVHSNLFFLISSYMKTSCPNGLLPEKQKVGESCGLQGAVACGAPAREMLFNIHHKI